MVYDCFSFFNEVELLKLRMQIMNPFVDKFVICEATVSFSGASKPLYFQENRKYFSDFEDKIIYVVVDDMPKDDAFARDGHQKSAVKRGLTGCNDDDIIIFSDLDEIPNPKMLQKILETYDSSKTYFFAQRNFYCYMNLEDVNGKFLSISGEFEGIEKKKWLGTKMASWSIVKNETFEHFRNRKPDENSVRIDDGGWHFGYMGGDANTSAEDRVKNKIKCAAHQEFNKDAVLNQVSKRIKKKQDFLGRNAQLEKVKIDSSYPEYLLEHFDEYSFWILQSKWEKFVRKITER